MWKTVSNWLKVLSKVKTKQSNSNFHLFPEHASYAAKRLLSFAHGSDSSEKHTLEQLDQGERGKLQNDIQEIILLYMQGIKPNTTDTLQLVEGFAARALNKGKAKCKERLHTWLDKALKNGAGLAHKWANQPNALPPLQLVIPKGNGNFIVEPSEVTEHHVKPWVKEWEAEDVQGFLEETAAIKAIRNKHLEEAEDWAQTLDLSPSNIRRACKTFPSKTAVGCDNVFFSDIASLPDVALIALSTCLRQCVSTLALPVQTLLQLMVLLGKKSGGSRTIAILTTFYRLLMRILSGFITEWDLATAEHWDSALKGNSSLRAHIARALDIELANFEELFVLHCLWDMRKFYDSIRTSILIDKLTEKGYPPFVMILGLLTHKSPRILLVGPAASNPITGCKRSIVAGCQQSVSWARGLLFDFVQSLGYIMPGSICHEHVDDLSHVLTCKSKSHLFNKAVEIGLAVKQGVQELDLQLADKSAITTNSNAIAKAVASTLPCPDPGEHRQAIRQARIVQEILTQFPTQMEPSTSQDLAHPRPHRFISSPRLFPLALLSLPVIS